MVCAFIVSTVAGCTPAIRGLGGVRLDSVDGLVAVFGLCGDFGNLSTVRRTLSIPKEALATR